MLLTALAAGTTTNDWRSRSVSRIAIARQRALRPALRVDPGQRRVPGDVDRLLEQRVDLALVVGVENDVHRAAARFEEVADDVPDHRHLGVVEHGADDDRTWG